MIVPIVLSGGAGTRLWPLSRELYPKQLLPLVGDRSLLQNTVLRLAGIEGVSPPVVVCNESYRFMVAEQLRLIGRPPAAILLEPAGRNTAPATAAAAFHALQAGEDPVLLVLPADHVIQDVRALIAAVNLAEPLAEAGRLITFGVLPHKPETGYGYIRRGERIAEQAADPGAYSVDRFVEKPDLATAQAYVASGEYYWNSGMFMFRASVYLEELERFAPGMIECCRAAVENAVQDLDFIRLDPVAFDACPGDSIDYAVMEKTEGAVVIPLGASWSDVGSWVALWEVGARDDADNVFVGDVLTRGVRNSYLHAESRLLAAVGVEDLVVVETADAVLVSHKGCDQEVKIIVNELKAREREEAVSHRKVFRPWGSYECVDRAERFQVKRITVHPGASLSLQMHHHRAEHWVVVKGTARVTRGEEVSLLTENQSTYISPGTTHRLENPGKIPLELIEVQSGSYLGEDDILRFDDRYGRKDSAS